MPPDSKLISLPAIKSQDRRGKTVTVIGLSPGQVPPSEPLGQSYYRKH
jgi:hypothetical protein